ncbi:MAG: aldo/keto reductase [Candidatus Sumerlaeota bacterium]|nr:aldo/keto reductase [Candidatus Sumerlaeota bacterium]
MIYRQYGKTGIEVSALGFGGMRFERPNDVDDMAEVCLRAYDGGVTYFDTAPGYCGDKSEEIVGCAVKEMKKRKSGQEPIIATKTFSCKMGDVRRELETSLKRLNVDAIDFYHVWCVLSREGLEERKKDGVIKNFIKLKEEGLIRHIAVSSHMRGEEIEAMLDAYPEFEGILFGFCAANFPIRQQGIAAAARRGLGVVAMNPLGGGLITQYPDRFACIRQQEDCSVLEAALRFNLSYPGLTTSIVGFRNTKDVDEALEAVRRYKRLTEADIEAVKKRVLGSFENLCTMCGYCQPCPAGLQVPRLMDAYNLWKLTQKAQDTKNHLKYHWGIGDLDKTLDQCTECGHCEQVCTQHLNIMERFKELREAIKKA